MRWAQGSVLWALGSGLGNTSRPAITHITSLPEADAPAPQVLKTGRIGDPNRIIMCSMQMELTH